MTEIVGIHGREIFDSRGNPTVEAEVRLAGGAGSPSSPCPRGPRLTLKLTADRLVQAIHIVADRSQVARRY